MASSVTQTPTLLGQPELYKNKHLRVSFSQKPTNKIRPIHGPNGCKLQQTTENGSATFLSSGNPCLDFFFHVVPNTPSESLVQRLKLAWEHDPLKTLKLVCNLCGVRGTGKSDNEGYYTAALWFHKNHPKTLACNARCMAEFGYFKDFPEILFRLVEGEEIGEGEVFGVEDTWQESVQEEL